VRRRTRDRRLLDEGGDAALSLVGNARLNASDHQMSPGYVEEAEANFVIKAQCVRSPLCDFSPSLAKAPGQQQTTSAMLAPVERMRLSEEPASTYT
jgi:hypothetical protein